MPSQVRRMLPVEAAWVGAALDGEGYVIERYNPKRQSFRLGFEIVNCDPEFISALMRATGVGYVYEKTRTNPAHSFALTWRAHRKEDALDIARQCSPYSVKCQKLLRLAAV